MSDTIDLTLDDDAPMPPASSRPPASEDDQRKRIMAFAAGVAKKKEEAPGGSGGGGGGKRRRVDAGGGGEAAAAPGASGAGGGEGGGFGSGGGGDAGGANALLRELHAQRMARMQQQQQQQQAAAPQAGASASSAEGKAATSAAEPPAAVAPQPQKRTGAAAKQAPAAAAGPSRQAGGKAASVAPSAASGQPGPSAGGAAAEGAQQRRVTLLQYNVWFEESAAVEARMQGLGRIIKDAGYPTFITLQEVTPLILSLLQSSDWWGNYVASDAPQQPYFTLILAHKARVPGVSPASFRRQPFPNSIMGRCLLTLMTTAAGVPVAVATSHLESPCPPQGLFVEERAHQMRDALRVLDEAPAGNVIFAGDMNWVDSRDGAPPLKASWCDCWARSHPGDPGFTYDSKSNKMLVGNWPGNRLDRVLARLRDLRIVSMRIVGQDPIPGATYTKTFKNGGTRKLPVLPSDHYGLLLELEAQ